MKSFLVVNGPNLNLLGKREPEIYGTRTLADLTEVIGSRARQLGIEVAVFQSNDEGEIISFLQKEGPGADGIVMNPAALSHYSLALYDCLVAIAKTHPLPENPVSCADQWARTCNSLRLQGTGSPREEIQLNWRDRWWAFEWRRRWECAPW